MYIMRIRTILTDNGNELPDRPFGLRKRAQSCRNEFDRRCTELDIEHRPPRKGRPKPTALLSASTVGLRMFCKVITSDQAKS
jgi:hypothetical protein